MIVGRRRWHEIASKYCEGKWAFGEIVKVTGLRGKGGVAPWRSS